MGCHNGRDMKLYVNNGTHNEPVWVEAAVADAAGVAPSPEPNHDDPTTYPNKCERCEKAGPTSPFTGWQYDQDEYSYLCEECYGIAADCE